MNAKANTAMNRTDFEQALRDKGQYHPPPLPYGGQCTPEQIRGWVANRYYYQINIPQLCDHGQLPGRQRATDVVATDTGS